MAETLKKTSLHDEHLRLKAKMAPFAGFDMPLQYTSVKEEVAAVRTHAGVFDVTHMGEFFVEGPDAVKFVDHLIPNDFANAGELKAVYSPLCRENGTVIDDLIAYKLSANKVLIVVNASNMEKDWKWISPKTKGFNCKIDNKTEHYSLLAIQGPKTEELFFKLGLHPGVDMPYYSIREHHYKNEAIILARTGYTGEDGFELFCSDKMARTVWNDLLGAGVVPCGLVARDVLRTEVCYPLYGHELTDELTPLDAALSWTVKMDKGNFIGKGALASHKPRLRLIKLALEKGIPRDGYAVLNEQLQVIGKVTSGTMSPTINKGIAMALVEKDKFKEGGKLFVQVRNNNFEATFMKKPFVTGGHK